MTSRYVYTAATAFKVNDNDFLEMQFLRLFFFLAFQNINCDSISEMYLFYEIVRTRLTVHKHNNKSIKMCISTLFYGIFQSFHGNFHFAFSNDTIRFIISMQIFHALFFAVSSVFDSLRLHTTIHFTRAPAIVRLTFLFVFFSRVFV